MPRDLVLGLDVGGTSSRAAVVDVDGGVVGAGVASGGNPVTAGGAGTVAAIRAVLSGALDGVDPARIGAAVIGLAGGSVGVRETERLLRTLWRDVGLRCAPRPVDDVLLAFVSGTCARDGTVVVAGTGAVAAMIRGRVPLRIADGHGWLLGDRGSGFWIGREAVSATLTGIDDDGRLTALGLRVLHSLVGLAPRERCAGARSLISVLVEGAHRSPTVTLSRLAPVVLAAAADGDPDAVDIVDRAAGHLLDSITRVRRSDVDGPIVLGGGVLVADSPLQDALRVRVAARWPTSGILLAGNTALAAAWLALHTLLPDPVPLYETLFARATLG